MEKHRIRNKTAKRETPLTKRGPLHWIVLLMTLCLITGCAGNPEERPNTENTESDQQGTESTNTEIEYEFDFPVQQEKLTIKIPGMQGEKTILFLSDLHLITMSDQVADDQKGTVEARMTWSSRDGVTASEAWPIWIEYLDAWHSDAVLLGGDMIDFASRSNVERLKEGLSELKTPYLYVRADHDLAPSYLYGVFESESIGYQKEIEPYDDVMILEFEEFIIAGWNNSTAQMTVPALQKMKTIFEKAKAEGKSILLLTHVPIKPLGDNLEDEASSSAGANLVQRSKAEWGDRILLWGKGCAYNPDETTSEFLNMIYDENTPVKEILCGHLHFSWDGFVTESVHQHVFSAALDRFMGVLIVSGE